MGLPVCADDARQSIIVNDSVMSIHFCEQIVTHKQVVEEKQTSAEQSGSFRLSVLENLSTRGQLIVVVGEASYNSCNFSCYAPLQRKPETM